MERFSQEGVGTASGLGWLRGKRGYALLFACLTGLLCLSGCTVPVAPRQGEDVVGQRVQGKLERANQLSATRSALELEGYVARHGLDSLRCSGQGFYYSIWGKGLGASPTEGQGARCAYSLALLDGTEVERVEESNPVTVLVGHRDWPAGLEILLTQMQPGQEALLLLPSHLGYGIRGKGDVVPPNSCLVYRVKLLGVDR